MFCRECYACESSSVVVCIQQAWLRSPHNLQDSAWSIPLHVAHHHVLHNAHLQMMCFAPLLLAILLQVAHQHVPQDANLVLSQDELKLGERLILHLRAVHSSLPESKSTDTEPPAA